MALKIIGAGLGRTGTASLKVALETLGFGNCYHMTEVMQNPSYIEGWMEAVNGNADWDNIFADYGACVDYPACTFWRELAEHFPDAKIILTVRDADSWFDSTSETIMSPKFSDFIKNSPWGKMIEKTIWETLDNRMEDSDFMVPYFNKRNQEIIDAFPSDRLLVYQVKEGWGSLCDFLDVAVPEGDFPRINSRDETRALLEGVIAASGEKLDDDAVAAAANKLHGNKAD